MPNMEYRPISVTVGRIASIAILGFLAACDFEPDIDPVDWQTGDERRFGNPSSGEVNPDEVTDADIEILIDEVFEPYNLPGDQVYGGSVYERADLVLKGAYAYYGYDLDNLAMLKQDNPLTEHDFLKYLNSQHVTSIQDSVTGEDFFVFAWLETGAIGTRGGLYLGLLSEIGVPNPDYPMNYERNYLAALLKSHPLELDEAKDAFRDQLRFYYGENAAEVYEFLETVDSFEVE